MTCALFSGLFKNILYGWRRSEASKELDIKAEGCPRMRSFTGSTDVDTQTSSAKGSQSHPSDKRRGDKKPKRYLVGEK